MKGESVLHTPLRNWVEKADAFTTMFDAMDIVLRTPTPLRNKTYKKVMMADLEEFADYNRIHGFEESHVYAHVFYLDDQLYKKFILLAKKNDCAWRAEVTIPTKMESIIPPDYVPPALVFGSFFPIVEEKPQGILKQWFSGFKK